jgi:hypothetical protein
MIDPQPETTGAIGSSQTLHECGELGAATPEDARGLVQHPGCSHALGCMFNGMPCLECCCGLPNKPEVK